MMVYDHVEQYKYDKAPADYWRRRQRIETAGVIVRVFAFLGMATGFLLLVTQ